MTEMLEFSNIYQEVKGSMKDGHLRLNHQGIIFRSTKTGKVDNIQAQELTEGIWRQVAMGHGLKLLVKNGHVYKYDGFQESQFQKLSNFFKTHYHLELLKQDLCVKGWNWGTVKVGEQLLSFDMGEQPVFEIPLSNVSQCTTSKNEVTLEFHQSNDTKVSLAEMRFYVPPIQKDGVDLIETFAQNVRSKADITQASADAICIFRELQFLTPRGRYDIHIYPTFLHLHGKTFDYKITYSMVTQLFLLPHKDQHQMFFVISLDPPIKQGQTRYHFLILLFPKGKNIALTLNMDEEEAEKRFEGQLTRNMLGPSYEVFSQIMKVLAHHSITVPGTFQGHLGAQCITCSYKAGSGLLYPLEQGFIYVHKPPVHVHFREISSVNFARDIATTRFFDLDIETNQGIEYTFSSIQKDEHEKLFDFISAKKLNIRNQGSKEGKNPKYHRYADSDEDQHDAYLERMKEEGKAGKGNPHDSTDDMGEEMDMSFEPGEDQQEDVTEAFDSNVSTSSFSNKSDSDQDEKEQKQFKRGKMAKDHKAHKKTVAVKKGGHPSGPRKPMSAYRLWLNANQEKIKSDHPGISITDLSKKAEQIWKGMSKEKKEKWSRKAEGARCESEKAMREHEGDLGKSPKKDTAKKKLRVKMSKKCTSSKDLSSRSSSRQLGKSSKSKKSVLGKEKEQKEEVVEWGTSTPSCSEDSASAPNK